jgi:hypothetical protein
VKDENACLLPAESESRQMRRDQVQEKQAANQIAAGKPRNF